MGDVSNKECEKVVDLKGPSLKGTCMRREKWSGISRSSNLLFHTLYSAVGSQPINQPINQPISQLIKL